MIRDRIRLERLNFATEDIGTEGQDYPTLMAQFEGLVVDREFAEQSYRAALTALDVARTNAARQSRYLAVYHPADPAGERAIPAPRDDHGLRVAFSLSLGWAIMAADLLQHPRQAVGRRGDDPLREPVQELRGRTGTARSSSTT